MCPNAGHREGLEEGLGLYQGTRLPFFKGVPCRLDGMYNAKFEGCTVLLRHDERLLQQVFFEDLALHVAGYSCVGWVPYEMNV